VTSSFATVWSQMIQRLHPGEMIRAWGYARGYTGHTFRIEALGSSAVTVFGGAMKQPRAVSKGDFEKVYAIWNEYRTGNFPRAKMTELSQHTTYILSILHHVEAA